VITLLAVVLTPWWLCNSATTLVVGYGLYGWR
jgi:hypothetical protein